MKIVMISDIVSYNSAVVYNLPLTFSLLTEVSDPVISRQSRGDPRDTKCWLYSEFGSTFSVALTYKNLCNTHATQDTK
jgi:hypothetical protein